MSEKLGINDNNNFEPSFFGHYVKSSVIVLVSQYFSSGSALPQKIPQPKTRKGGWVGHSLKICDGYVWPH